jgi:hypothetical protein
MNILKSLLSRALLAVALATGAGAAAAGPLYHVDLDLTKFAGLGNLDIQFVSAGQFSPATATLSGFNAYFNEYAEKTASVTGSVKEGKIVFDNSGWADLFQSISLGQHLGFDISFDGPDSGLNGTAFTIDLWDQDGMNQLFDPHLLQVILHPGEMLVEASKYASLTEKTAAVPEPSAAMLVLIGLMMAGAASRRRA